MTARVVTLILIPALAASAAAAAAAPAANCMRTKKWQWPVPIEKNAQLYEIISVDWETDEKTDVNIKVFLIDKNGKVESKPCGTYKAGSLAPGEDRWIVAKCGDGKLIGIGAKLVADGAGVKFCSDERKIYLNALLYCGLGFVLNGDKCMKAPAPPPPDWRPRDNECVNMESSLYNGDDHRISVTCGYDRVLASCRCQPLDAGKGYCDGVTISDSGKTCNAWGAGGQGGSFKAVACCKKLKGTIVLVSKPQNMMTGGKPTAGTGTGATVDCPKGSKVISCTHHTYHGTRDIQVNIARKVQIHGRRCQATGCHRCNVQAICQANEGECKGSQYQIDGNDNAGDDKISEATCPDDTVLKACKCHKVTMKNCDGVTVSGDGRTCYAHGGYTGGWLSHKTTFRARGCCAKRTGSVITISQPWVMEDMSRWGSSDKGRKYLDSPIATCPAGYKVSFCVVHTYEMKYWGGLSFKQTATQCKASEPCHKCGIQAICEKPKGSGNAVYELRGSWIYKDDGVSETTCPRDHVISSCECELYKNGGKYCDGVTTTADGRTCRAWGALYGGPGVRAKATCKKRTGQITVVSKPHNIINAPKKSYSSARGPTVDCPKGSVIVACLAHTYWGHKSYLRDAKKKVTKVGRRCSVGSKCSYCGISAICESKKAAPTSCLYEVESVEYSGDDYKATAFCPRGTAVTKCKCISTETNGNCDGALVDGSGRSCIAHGGDRRRFKARACCGRADRGNVLVVSMPERLTDANRWVSTKNARYLDSPIAKCPKGYKVWYCQVHTYEYHYWRHLKTRIGDKKERCYADIKCDKCAVQAVCTKPYH